MVRADVDATSTEAAPLGYWSSYSALSPAQRRKYLEWLASGRSHLPADEGMLFLYYYGLERRLLLDNLDKEWVLREVVRLRMLDKSRPSDHGASFRRYSSNLLCFELARAPARFAAATFDLVCDLADPWREDSVRAPLAWVAHHGRPLPSRLARGIARLNPRSTRSVVVRRVPREFEDLFDRRYAERYGEGMALKIAKRPARFVYQPASPSLTPATCEIPSPLGAPKQFEPLADIWNSCVDDLRRLSKLGAGGGESLTSEAWEALPPELRSETDHPLAAGIQRLVAERTPRAGAEAESDDLECLIAVSEIALLHGIPERPRLTLAQSRKVAETVTHAGFAIEPDATLAALAYGWNDAVAIYPRLDESEVDRSRYRAASTILELGLSVAAADGEIEPSELERLVSHIDAAFRLPLHEQRRLDALRAVLRRDTGRASKTASRLRDMLGVEARAAVGRTLVAVASAGGDIDRAETVALRRAFRALDLPPEALEEAIGRFAPGTNAGVVTVRQAAAVSSTGEPIPTPPGAAAFALDRDAINAIVAETREVARLLAEAVQVDDIGETDLEPTWHTPDSASPAPAGADAPPPSVAAGAPASPAQPGGPPPRYAGLFLALVARERWTREDLAREAARLGLMLDGALEAINEWSFDTHGSPVVEEDAAGFVVNAALRAQRSPRDAQPTS